MRLAVLLTLAVAALVAAGCGGDDGGGPTPPEGVSQSDFERQLREAATVTADDFPATRGRTLQELANTAQAGPKVGLATSVLVPGENRLAFGVIGTDNEFLYGKSAVYVAPTPNDEAQGPFPAPADSLVTKPEFRSQQAASAQDEIAAVYGAEVPFERPGRHAVLVLTKTASGVVGAATQVEVVRDSPIPAVGERPPAVETDTLESAGGVAESIDTRVPPAESLHETSFADVVGNKPITLLFATPQLCQSRVCGPVADIALQLQQTYGDRMTFIHQEVYVDNDLNKGTRPQLLAYRLDSEPWLYVIDGEGKVSTAIEGAYSVEELEAAVQKVLG